MICFRLLERLRLSFSARLGTIDTLMRLRRPSKWSTGYMSDAQRNVSGKPSGNKKRGSWCGANDSTTTPRTHVAIMVTTKALIVGNCLLSISTTDHAQKLHITTVTDNGTVKLIRVFATTYV